MTGWLLAALMGGLLSIAGFLSLLGQFRRGEIRGRYLAAFGAGAAGLVAFALINAFRGGGGTALLALLPTLAAIVVIARERRR